MCISDATFSYWNTRKNGFLYWTDNNWTMGCKYTDEYELLPHKNKHTHKLWFKCSLLKGFFIWIKLQNGYNHRTYVEYIISMLLYAHTNPIMCSYQCRYLIISMPLSVNNNTVMWQHCCVRRTVVLQGVKVSMPLCSNTNANNAVMRPNQCHYVTTILMLFFV